MASVSIGRSLFPPEEIRWLATSGIMVTSEPVRDRIVALTRSMSAATRPTSASIEASWGLSKGTITATPVSTFAILDPHNRKCHVMRQGQVAIESITWSDRRASIAGIGSNQRYRAGFGDRRVARRRPDRSLGRRPEHEHHRRLARHPAAAHPGARGG